MPALKLKSGGSTGSRTRSKSSSKPAPGRKQSAAKRGASKPAPRTRQTEASEDTGSTRSQRIPEGMSQREFDKLQKDMARRLKVKTDAEEKVKEARAEVNEMALDLIADGIPMAIVSRGLELSRQWLYKIMEDAGVKTDRQAGSKPAARKRSAAKQAPAKSSAKKSSGRASAGRKAPAKRSPGRKPAAKSSGRQRVRIAA